MFDLDSNLNDLISNCRAAFGERLYPGLQLQCKRLGPGAGRKK